MAPVALVILEFLGLIVSRGARAPDGRTARLEIARVLDLVFCLGIIGVLAVKLGAFRTPPLQSSGYEAFSALFGLLFTLAWRAVVFVLLPTALVCWFLRRFESLTPRLIVYGMFGIAGYVAWQAAEQRRLADNLAAVRALEAQQEEARLTAQEALSLEQARQNAARREIDDRERLQQQVVDLRLRARDRWRASLQTQGAIGVEGEAPPGLQVVEQGPYQVRVTNHQRGRVCVQLVRALRKPGTDVYLRCPSDLAQSCTYLARGAGMTVNLLPDDRSPACAQRQFEYRLGTPLKPEFSWWSASAVRHFDESPPNLREPVISDDLRALRGEIQRLEKLLGEQRAP